jgi:hypothetical protein
MHCISLSQHETDISRGWNGEPDTVLENTGTDFREIQLKGVEWINLAQFRDQWRVLVNTVMNLRIPKKAENFFDQMRRRIGDEEVNIPSFLNLKLDRLVISFTLRSLYFQGQSP